MFSFDGDFKRRPQQDFGGSSSHKTDRMELIRKAKMERQKREEIRNRENGAVIIQSHVRSFIIRQRIKKHQREIFDEFLKLKGVNSEEDLIFLLRKILFFYYIKNAKDGERLIVLCQYLIKNPNSIYKHVINKHWLYRIRKLLGFCMEQIFATELSPAIPFRMLDVFTSLRAVKKYMSDPEQINSYLKNIFIYLISKNYFKQIRQLIEDKVPPLDEEITVAPNPASEAILKMMLRPLKFLTNTREDCLILSSFARHILSQEFTDPIKYFILPALSTVPNFPYNLLIQFLAEFQQSKTDDVMIVDGTDFYRDRISRDEEPIYSPYLLYSVLVMDRLHLDNLNNNFTNYLNVISSMTEHFSKLPKNTVQIEQKSHESSDSDSGDHEDEEMFSAIERETLFDILRLLEDTRRSVFIVEQIDFYLDEPKAIQYICQIDHDLMSYNRSAVYDYKLLHMFAFKPKFIRALWYNLVQTAQKGFSSPIHMLSKGLVIPKHDADNIIPILATFCALFGRLISSLHDGEFCNDDVLPGVTSKMMPFTVEEIIPLSTTLKEICLGLVELAFPETRQVLKENYRYVLNKIANQQKTDSQNSNKNIWPNLLRVCVSLLRQLHTRDLRKGFCPEGHWTSQNLNLPLDKPTDLQISRNRRGLRPFKPLRDFTREDVENGPPMSTKQIRSITILREIPFVVSFNTRVGVLQGLLAADKLRVQGDLQGFLQGPFIQLLVRRTHLYEDAFDKLSPENEADLRPRFRIQMINTVGLEEVGIDGGGVFREFLSELIKTAFDPHRGFFMITTDNKLYPNPSVHKIVDDYQKHYYFIGRILGKALYENLLVELPLAEFFLSKLAGKHSDVDVHQLASLDPVLHRNLLSLKAYDGDVADLGLDFTVVCDELGETRVEELKPNGSNITVDSSNRIEYIQLMADFKLNKQIRQQCMAFRHGISNVLPVEWLYMFSNKELQVLMSGAEIPVDIEDLRTHTRYGGDFNLEHPTIEIFWTVLDSFTDIQKRQLLKFVTSCSRPPLLGFKDLDPPFCIQNAGDLDRLPSASTCMNLLKLPAFNSEKLLREKLLYAIQSGAGFELS